MKSEKQGSILGWLQQDNELNQYKKRMKSLGWKEESKNIKKHTSAIQDRKRRQVSINEFIFKRKLGIRFDNVSLFNSKFQYEYKDVYVNESRNEVAILACKFGKVPRTQPLIAIGDEDGNLILKTNDTLNSNQHIAQDMITDISFQDEDNKLFICNGGGYTIQYSVEYQKIMMEYPGHESSIKCHDKNRDLLITGGRDGNILLFDIRMSNFVLKWQSKHVNKINNKNPSFNHAISSVRFLNLGSNTTFLSTGSNNGYVKQWDIRKPDEECMDKGNPQKQNDLQQYGISNLILNSDHTHSYLSCANNSIYCINNHNLNQEPITKYYDKSLNLKYSYTHMSLSPNQNYMILNHASQDLVFLNLITKKFNFLNGHIKNINYVDWCDYNMNKLLSCSDDGTCKLWKINNEFKG